MRIIIIGAGVIGTTTAWFLARNGYQVHVLDRAGGPAEETSHANGGLLHASHAEPWNAPGVTRQLLRFVGREDSPLLVRPRHLPWMLCWGLAFLRNSNRRQFERTTFINTRLALYSLESLRELRKETGIRYDDRHNGILKVFRDRSSLDQALRTSTLTRELGLRFTVLDRYQSVALEPALGPVGDTLAGGIHYPEDESGDARLFTRELAAMAERQGVHFEFGVRVERIHRDADRVACLDTTAGRRQADAYVLAAGSSSPLLARQVGLRLPIHPVKGYSCTIPVGDGRGAPRIPVIDDAGKVVMAVLGNRFRIAGTAEFAGYDHTLNHSRAENVLKQAARTFPMLERHLPSSDISPWCGLRPVTTDGAPVLGPTPLANLHLNCGPGHLGWTFACGAARLVTDLIAGRRPDLPLDGLTHARFRPSARQP